MDVPPLLDAAERDLKRMRLSIDEGLATVASGAPEEEAGSSAPAGAPGGAGDAGDAGDAAPRSPVETAERPPRSAGDGGGSDGAGPSGSDSGAGRTRARGAPRARRSAPPQPR
jgi:hypothetical protein